MDNLEVIRHLYGEEPDRPLEEVLAEDAEGIAAYEGLVEARDLLAARGAARPHPSVIDAVVDLAAKRAVARPDAASGSVRLIRLLRPVSWAAAACLVGIAGYWVGRNSVDETSSLPRVAEQGFVATERQTDEAAPAPADARAVDEPRPASPQMPFVTEMQGSLGPSAKGSRLAESAGRSAKGSRLTESAGPAPSLSDAITALPPTARVGDVVWEGAEDLFVIQSRVLSLEEALSGIEWDQAVPLGAMQGGGARPYSGAAATEDSSVRRPPH